MKYGGINGDCRLNIFFKKYRYVTVARREYELKFFCYFYKLEKNLVLFLLHWKWKYGEREGRWQQGQQRSNFGLMPKWVVHLKQNIGYIFKAWLCVQIYSRWEDASPSEKYTQSFDY